MESVTKNAMQGRLQAPSAATRATVVMALRFTFNETAPEYDTLLRPIMAHLGTLMADSDLVREHLLGRMGRMGWKQDDGGWSPDHPPTMRKLILRVFSRSVGGLCRRSSACRCRRSTLWRTTSRRSSGTCCRACSRSSTTAPLFAYALNARTLARAVCGP